MLDEREVLTYQEAVNRVEPLTIVRVKTGDASWVDKVDDDLGDALHDVIDAVFGKKVMPQPGPFDGSSVGGVDWYNVVLAASSALQIEQLEHIVELRRKEEYRRRSVSEKRIGPGTSNPDSGSPLETWAAGFVGKRMKNKLGVAGLVKDFMIGKRKRGAWFMSDDWPVPMYRPYTGKRD